MDNAELERRWKEVRLTPGELIEFPASEHPAIEINDVGCADGPATGKGDRRGSAGSFAENGS